MQVAPGDSPRGRSAIPSPQELGSECFAANSIGSADLTHELPMAARSHSTLLFAAPNGVGMLGTMVGTDGSCAFGASIAQRQERM